MVKTPDELAGRVRHVFERDGGPALVEQYIPGREFHVHVIEESTEGQRSRLRVMPAAEVQFRSASGAWPIYSYEAKWNESSEEHRKVPWSAASNSSGRCENESKKSVPRSTAWSVCATTAASICVSRQRATHMSWR